MRVFSPLDDQWELGPSVYSPERVKQMAWLATTVPYAAAVEIFQRIGYETIPQPVCGSKRRRWAGCGKPSRQRPKAK
jgi:hypothetical protein